MIVAGGGIDIVLSAMRRHSVCVDVQEHGCAALCSIFHGGGDGDGDFYGEAIGDAGGVDIVTAAMSRHADSAAVQRHGCVVLQVMAIYGTNAAAIVAAGGVSLVVSAMRRHEEVSMAHIWIEADVTMTESECFYREVGDDALNTICGRAVSDV
jgi:hypothetical protein